ncbi:hypothetical protein [Mycolicibacterium palauense]|uniref:hypothetical protein n=1 Tax=Mycolicibacterium palauense TaxID=2034511 RepID=UPI00114551E5
MGQVFCQERLLLVGSGEPAVGRLCGQLQRDVGVGSVRLLLEIVDAAWRVVEWGEDGNAVGHRDGGLVGGCGGQGAVGLAVSERDRVVAAACPVHRGVGVEQGRRRGVGGAAGSMDGDLGALGDRGVAVGAGQVRRQGCEGGVDVGADVGAAGGDECVDVGVDEVGEQLVTMGAGWGCEVFGDRAGC